MTATPTRVQSAKANRLSAARAIIEFPTWSNLFAGAVDEPVAANFAATGYKRPLLRRS